MSHLRHVSLLGLVALVGLTINPSVPAADADAAVQKTFEKLLAAIKANDRKAFVADASDAVKEGVTEKIMEDLNKQLGTRLKNGHEATYLCQLKQRGVLVHMWKLTFKDGGDDVVVRVALKQGKVEGFFLQ